MLRLELHRQFAQNLEIERFKLGLTQKQMAGKLDTSLSAYKRLINGETTKVDLYLIYRLYLLTGKLAYEFTDVSDKNLELKRKIFGLSQSQISYLEAIIEFEKAFAREKENADNAEEYVTVFIPTGNMEDGMIYDSASFEKMKVPAGQIRFGCPVSFGIRITSNHLHPVYNKGDTLLISRKTIRDGDTGVFLNTETSKIYIRKFYQTSPCRLEPVNGLGEPIYVDDKNEEEMARWLKLGCVIAKLR